MKHALLFFMLLLPSALSAQTIEVPAGTILPLQLETGMKAEKLAAGKIIRGVIMQDIPSTRIRRGSHVYGHVIRVNPTSIEFTFDTLEVKKQRIPITTNLRALASMMEVDQAQIPQGGADRGLPPSQKTTEQIGGELVYRGGGHVMHGSERVGEPAPYGVIARTRDNPPCRAVVAHNHHPQALWLFSTDACGLYSYDNLTIEHYGRTAPIGTIILTAKKGKVNIRSGSGILLRVQGS